MKIDWLEFKGKRHVLAWLLCEAMSSHGIENFKDFDSSNLDVDFKVNGIEVDILKSMNFLQRQLDNIREEGTLEGMRNTLNLINDNITRIENGE